MPRHRSRGFSAGRPAALFLGPDDGTMTARYDAIE